jgi:alkylhydroperoxidase family enzyme
VAVALAPRQLRTVAFIAYVPDERIPDADKVPDSDNILRIHGIHPRTMRQHYELYVELMRGASPLTRIQREMIAVVVSAANRCHY